MLLVHLLFYSQRNWVFATNSVFVKPISLQPYDVNIRYFKLTLFDLIAFIVWNIKGLRHWVATILKLENPSLWQKLNSFENRKFLRFHTYNSQHLFFFSVCFHINDDIELLKSTILFEISFKVIPRRLYICEKKYKSRF